MSAHRPERIVVGVDGSPDSRAAVRWALEHATPDDSIVLVHAWQPSPAMVDAGLVRPDDDTGAQALVHQELVRASELRADTRIRIECRVVRGAPGTCLASADDASMVVVGARGHGAVGGLLLGSVSAYLARHCAAPLVIIPARSRPHDE